LSASFSGYYGPSALRFFRFDSGLCVFVFTHDIAANRFICFRDEFHALRRIDVLRASLMRAGARVADEGSSRHDMDLSSEYFM
jgi:hypothetical protein